jgi:hypothetical protein
MRISEFTEFKQAIGGLPHEFSDCRFRMLVIVPRWGKGFSQKESSTGVDEQGEWRIQDLVHPLLKNYIYS